MAIVPPILQGGPERPGTNPTNCVVEDKNPSIHRDIVSLTWFAEKTPVKTLAFPARVMVPLRCE